MIQIALYPFPKKEDSNIYLKMIKENTEDEKIKFVAFENSVWSTIWMDSNDVPIVFLNWYESLFDTSFVRSFVRFIKRSLIIHILKLKKVKIVTTVHNKIPHDVKWKKSALGFMKLLFEKANTIVILCDDTNKVIRSFFSEREFKGKIEAKIAKIPHPSYGGQYPEGSVDLRKMYGISQGEMVYLYMGAIKKYKNVELVLELANRFMNEKRNCKFVIAGGTSDSDYLESLKKSVSDNKNVTFIDHFIPDEEISDVMNMADIVVCPLNQKSALNSGSCMLALTFGKQLLCPVIGTIHESMPNLPYVYEYETDDEHMEKLYEKAEKAYNDYLNCYDEYKSNEERIKKEIDQKYNPKQIGEMYKQLFKMMR